MLLVAYRYRYKGSVYEVGVLWLLMGKKLAGAILAEEGIPLFVPMAVMMKNGYTLSSPPAAWSHEG